MTIIDGDDVVTVMDRPPEAGVTTKVHCISRARRARQVRSAASPRGSHEWRSARPCLTAVNSTPPGAPATSCAVVGLRGKAWVRLGAMGAVVEMVTGREGAETLPATISTAVTV